MLKRRRTFQAQEIGELDFSEELLELGVLIGSYRTARGIKQEDMAKLLGMSMSSGFMPRSPAMRALSVPWPRPVSYTHLTLPTSLSV